MFGIDIGISVSSVTCTTEKGAVLDYQILFGKKGGDDWKRCVSMANAIVDGIHTIIKSNKVYIAPLVSLEEPVYSFGTKNPRSYFNMCCLYTLIRKALITRGFKIYSINPVSVKSTAKAVFGSKKLGIKFAVRGRLTKKGMVRAYKKIHGKEPDYSNAVGRETLADSYFIAMTGIDRKRVGIRSDS